MLVIDCIRKQHCHIIETPGLHARSDERSGAGPGKEVTYILDFVSEPDEILATFRQYYRDAQRRMALPNRPLLVALARHV